MSEAETSEPTAEVITEEQTLDHTDPTPVESEPAKPTKAVWLQSQSLQLLIAAFTGAVLGLGAWGEGRAPYLAILLPIAIGLSGSRLRAFVLGLAYLLATERTGPAFIATWFDNNLAIGIAIWIGSSLVGGLAWSLGWTASSKPWRRALAAVVAWTITLLPPVAVVAMGHPLVAWGFLMQGTAWFGVAASVVVPAAFMWIHAREGWQVKPTAMGLAGVGVVALGMGIACYAPLENRFVADMAAVSTHWGAAKDGMEIIERIERMGRANERFAQDTDVKVVIYPEAAIQRYEPALYPVLRMEVLDPSEKAGQTIIIGADLHDPSGNFQSSAIAFYPDGKTATAVARQTVPIALWKPWQSSGSFVTDWGANNMLVLKDGIRARVIFCFEEYIPILSLINEALDDHNLVLVMSNTWAAENPLASVIQSRHSEGIARLFKKRLIRSENRPKEAS
jgi:hypothetical protein